MSGGEYTYPPHPFWYTLPHLVYLPLALWYTHPTLWYTCPGPLVYLPPIPPSWVYPHHWTYLIPGLTQPNPEETWDQAYPSPAHPWTDTCLWKHYLPAITIAGGNYWFVHFMVQYCCDWCRTYVLRNCCHGQISLSFMTWRDTTHLGKEKNRIKSNLELLLLWWTLAYEKSNFFFKSI